MADSTQFLDVEEAAEREGTESFYRNVKSAVIPRLIAKGLLNGKTEKKRQLVADDEAFARMMRHGVETFVYNQQGYSFMAVRAPIAEVAAALKKRPAVLEYVENVRPLRMKNDIGSHGDPEKRETFLVQMRDTPDWCVLIQTVHWFMSCDAVMVTAMAAALSADLNTLAAAAWDDDFSGSSLIVCEQGKQIEATSEEGKEDDSWVGFYEFFYENGIYLPESFIGDSDGKADLYVADPNQVERADRVSLKVPAAIESQGPHVFEKLGMMAEAMMEDLEDEEAFMEHMRGGIWEQAQAILNSGEF